jgi:arylsulfatase
VLIRGKSQTLFTGMGRLTENSVLDLKTRSRSVTAEVELPGAGASGVIIAQGGAFGGWSLYAKEGRLKYCDNLLGLQRFYIESAASLPASLHQVRMEVACDGGGLAQGGDISLFVDGTKVGEGRLPAMIPMVFSADETTDVGHESASSVSEDYDMHTSAFNGKIHWIQLDAGVDDFDHFISPEETSARGHGAPLALQIFRPNTIISAASIVQPRTG